MTNLPGNAKKRRRITRACDECHRRSVRCVAPEGPYHQTCRNCVEFGQACTYDREARKRGAKPRVATTAAAASTPSFGPTSRVDVDLSTPRRESPASTKRGPWKAAPIASQAVVMDMVDIYFEVVYPIFPYFHRPTFLRKIARGEYTTDRFLFAVTMSICALVSGRVRDGALFNPHWDTGPLLEIPSKVFYDAATRECRTFTPADAFDLNLLRASALLSIASIQAEDPAQMQMHLGQYHTLSATSGFHDEAQWPEGIGIIETEERRRLFWSVYTLDLFTSIVWNGVSRCRERQCNVAYPTEIDDEQFSDSGYQATAESPLMIGPSPTHSGAYSGRSHWLAGWNFTTDLYRVLEHVITHFRDRRRGRESFLTHIFGDGPTVSSASVRDSIMAMYTRLPRCFKETPAVTCNMSSDRYGFQAANITATIQLLRMLLFTSSDGTVEERCQIASEVVDAFMCIPVAYLQAISSPLMHHLTGIGAILGAVLGEPLNQTEYQSCRTVLLSLAQLLENLNHGVHSTKNAEKLRLLVAKIDEHVDSRQDANANANRHPRRARRSSPQVDRPALDLLADGFHTPRTTKTTMSGSEPPAESPRTYGGGQTDGRDLDESLQLPTELLEDWPWAVDFLHFAGP